MGYSLVVSFDSGVFDIQRVRDSCVLDLANFFSDRTERLSDDYILAVICREI